MGLCPRAINTASNPGLPGQDRDAPVAFRGWDGGGAGVGTATTRGGAEVIGEVMPGDWLQSDGLALCWARQIAITKDPQ